MFWVVACVSSRPAAKGWQLPGERRWPLVRLGLTHYSPPVMSVGTDAIPPSTRAEPKRYWQWLGGLVVTFVTIATPMGSPLYKLAWHGYHYGQPLSLVPSVLLVALLAPMVSYRRRDGLLLLVPIWGLVVTWTIGSRLSRLSQRDWPLRPDEVA